MPRTSSPSLSVQCRPRWATQRTPSRQSLGPALAKAAASFGQPFMPWQQLVADVGGELLPGTNIPAYREVVVTVPRQNGKTTLTLGWEVQRALGWGRAQRIAYTAQTGKDAREKLVNDQYPLLDPAMAPRLPVKSAVRRVTRGIGNEAVEFKSGSRIFILYSGEDSGHGKTLDLGVIDESFADEDDRREQAMLPAMLTVAEAQILNISTAGTDKSPFLKRKVDAGRAAVANGTDQGIAYFEWSADKDADIDDPRTWWSCMPALGYTITEASVIHARQTMTEGDFRRAMLNQWTISEERVIPAALWNEACGDSVSPEGLLMIAYDVNVERTASAIAVADSQQRVELVKFAPGVSWLAGSVIELAKKLKAAVVCDTYGPAGSFLPEIETAGIEIQGLGTKEVARACGIFYDAVADHKASIRRHAALDLAVSGVRKRQTGDTWVWGRQNANEDISPLIAVTLAYAQAQNRDSDVWFFSD